MRRFGSMLLAAASLTLNSCGGGETIRGIGEVRCESRGDAVRFECATPADAERLMHKFVRDLALSATGKSEIVEIPVGSRRIPALVRPGLGVFAPSVSGAVLTVRTAPTPGELRMTESDLAGARFYRADYEYPAWLDKYSSHGIGCWYPSNWGDKNSEGKPNTVDDHFRFARDRDLVLQPNDGGHLLRNLLPKLHEYNRPYHFAQWQEWSPQLAIMAPEELITTGPDFSAAPHYYGQISDGGHRLMGWNNWQLQNRIRRYGADRLLIDWPDPNGEVGPFNEDAFWDFTENNRKNFVRFLRDVRKYSPASLGAAWYGDSAKFRSWDDVPIPMNYDFFGAEPDSVRADRAWRLHPVAAASPLADGLKRGFQRDGFDDRNWVELPAPGGELFTIFSRAAKPTWFRGTMTVDAARLEALRKRGPVYLACATMAQGMGTNRPDRLWLNGVEVGAWSYCGGYPMRAQFDVTKLLRPGINRISYLPAHESFRGTFFLTGKPFETYPFRDAKLNARYVDWNEYICWAVADMLEQTYRAIRGVDPNRFIKMHAFGRKDYGTELGARYGAAQHNTGDEAFFRPWDRRFGYVRGIPASCEPSGSVDTPEHFKRWLGWHSFSGGYNALDYFHNIQSMMYSPAAELWKEYLPYWKLHPRRDLKPPRLALFWSSYNNRMLPRPVPYCFDLGRGDLQALGYSFVYIDESTVRDGLADAYPVIWDTGSWILTPETVAGLERCVRSGATLVLLQETGRHTPTVRDAWPIEKLSGFRVKRVRPMEGNVAFLAEPPLFRKMAGRNFYNVGKSIDYSDYNYADRCTELEPLTPEAVPAARYNDGGIAIGVRTLGKGRVVTLGSPFWRDSCDLRGVWWPGEKQNDFVEDLLTSLGIEPTAKSNRRGVWREHYLAANGAEEFLTLHNPTGDPVVADYSWRTVSPATALFDPKNGKPVPATIDGCAVTLKNLKLAPYETLEIAARSARPPREVVEDWYRRFARLWRPVAPGAVLDRPDLPLYELRLEDDLAGKALTPAEFSALPRVPAGMVTGACQSPAAAARGVDPAGRCGFAVRFKTPAGWSGNRVILRLTGMSHGTGNVNGPTDAWLNGRKLLTGANISGRGYGQLSGGCELPVEAILRPDGQENELVFAVGPRGFQGEARVEMRPAAAEKLDAAPGEWQVRPDADSPLRTVRLPGKFTGLLAWREIEIPASWKGKRVFVELDAAPNGMDSFAVNGKVIFHPVNWYDTVTFMDVTPWIRFGEKNRLTVISREATRNWKPGSVELRKFEIYRTR